MKLTHSPTVKKEKLTADVIQNILTEAEQNQAEILGKRWEEAIFLENHIIPRSYHSSVIYKSMMFVYGGYESNHGIMNDLIWIDLESKEPFFWKTMERSKGVLPEPLHRHSAHIYQDKMYIYGGKTSILSNSKKLYSYEFASNIWTEETENSIKINNSIKKEEILPYSIDSHSAVLFDDGVSAEIIIFGGFLGEYSKYSNNVFAYDLIKKEWKFYYQHISRKTKKNGEEYLPCPKKRCNSAILLSRNALYMFGGCKGSLKMNDFWKFDLMTSQWKEIIYEKKIIPEPRSGHIFVLIPNNIMLLFGGIHDIAHEKNDLLCYDESINSWFKVEEDSMKNLSEHNPLGTKKVLISNKNQEKSSEKSLKQTKEQNKLMVAKQHKKNLSLYFIRNTKKTNTESSKKLSTLDNTFGSNIEGKNPHQLQEERKKKVRQMKKMLLLSEFDVEEELKPNMIVNSPTTEAMKNSIIAIKVDMKATENRLKNHQKEPSQGNILVCSLNTLRGKKPCARDGCTGNVFHDKIIIFGGDRHLMAFHDLFFLNYKNLI